MTNEKKKQLADALNYIYNVSTKSPVEKVVHDNCFEAAKELMKHIESIEVEEPKESNVNNFHQYEYQ
jgi:uncharacterized membrane protein